MKATLRDFTPEFRTADGRLFGEGRSSGTHLSSVIRYIRVKLGQLNLTGNDVFAMFGFIFELLVEKALASYLTFNADDMIEPGEQELDGIKMNPDRFNPFLTRFGTVFEYKATWMSLGNGRSTPALLTYDAATQTWGVDADVLQDRFWYWVMQLASYCRVMGTRRGTIVALFINGDYTFRDPWGGPRFVVIDIVFTPDDIESNWETVVREARAMEKEEAA